MFGTRKYNHRIRVLRQEKLVIRSIVNDRRNVIGKIPWHRLLCPPVVFHFNSR